MNLQTPDTSLSKVARLGSRTRLWYAAPAAVSVTGFITDWPVAKYTLADGTSTEVDLGPQFSEQAVASSSGRDRLTLASAFSGAAPTLSWGDAFVWSPALGTIPVRIASVNGTDVRLVDRMPYDLPAVNGTILQSALWYSDEGPGLPMAAVTRDSNGDRPIQIEVIWSLRNASGGKTVHAERGELSVVRQPFLTGLTSAILRRLHPELGGYGQVGAAGFEAAIARAHLALTLQVRRDVREAGAAGGTWEDDVSAAPFLAAHAAFSAANVAESVAPERAQAYRDQAWPLYRSALASTAFDRNRTGTIDQGESPGLIGSSTASRIAPSISPGLNPRWRRGERR